MRRRGIKKNFNFLNKFTEAFLLPKDCVLGNMIILMSGKSQLFIENYRNIIEYTDTSLKIQGKNGKVFISGKSIFIETYNSDMMLIKGIFLEIKFY